MQTQQEDVPEASTVACLDGRKCGNLVRVFAQVLDGIGLALETAETTGGMVSKTPNEVIPRVYVSSLSASSERLRTRCYKCPDGCP